MMFCASIGGGSGGSGNPGGKIISAKFMTRIDRSSLSPGQISQANWKSAKVLETERELLATHSAVKIQRLVEAQVKELFQPDLFLFSRTPVQLQTYPALQTIAGTALRDNRLIHVPDLGQSRAIVTGQVEGELNDLYSAQLNTLGFNEDQLKALPFGSLTVVPLVCGYRPGAQLNNYDRPGVMVLGYNKPNITDPLIDLKPLRLYSETVAQALLKAS